MTAPTDPYPRRGHPKANVSPRSVLVHVRITPDAHAQLVTLAAEESARIGRTVTVSGIATAAVEAYVGRPRA